MKPLYFSILCVVFFLLFAQYNGLNFAADINHQTGILCSESDNSLNEDDDFLINLRTTLDSLADNVINRHGFYQTRVGDKKIQQSLWWCFLRYANQSFFGAMEETSMAVANDTDFKEAKVVLHKSLNLWEGLLTRHRRSHLCLRQKCLDVNVTQKRYIWDGSVHEISEKKIAKGAWRLSCITLEL
ncbi:hypothetical protein K1719_008507 [Acacia pycnantha]|nr:hypothetical protein K1719_008507 [Acacia pycnantha]